VMTAPTSLVEPAACILVGHIAGSARKDGNAPDVVVAGV